MFVCLRSTCYFFFNDTATTEIYTLSLHDALPISSRARSTRSSPSSATSSSGCSTSACSSTCGASSAGAPRRTARRAQHGKGHLLTPLTPKTPMPPSALQKKNKQEHHPFHLSDLAH